MVGSHSKKKKKSASFMMAQKKREKKGARFQYLLPGHAPNDLISSN
jgi:hypothetical protein